MAQKKLAPKIRLMADLLHAEITGRLHACEHLETQAEQIEDPRVLYGWNFLTQEVLIRLAEASLKLVYLLHFNKPSPKGHSLRDLWAQLPEPVQTEVKVKRRNFPGSERDVSFPEYNMEDFQDVRYSYERLVGGQTIRFEARRLFLDCLATNQLAEEWLGETAVWPWAGVVSSVLAGYKILPIDNGRFDILIDDPVGSMDWAGAIIQPKDGQYVWTLYCGYTDEAGKLRTFEVPGLLYQWPIEELFSDSVSACAEQVHRAFQEPCPALLQIIQLAENSKRLTNR